jgi:hypothetical protein
MKYFIALLLLSGSMYSQEQVFNVQRYCVDEFPFKIGECDILGNEYSFVFLDKEKKDVVFFFTNMKLKYKMEFLYPNNHIYLTVGKSTKL